MTIQEGYHNGRVIVEETESYFTIDDGSTVRRTETLLDDGTRLVQDTPLVVNAMPSHPGMPMASAPMEEDITGIAGIPVSPYPPPPEAYATANATADAVPIAHATSVPVSHVADLSGSSGPIAVVTGRPQPPRVAVVTGPPRPPPQVLVGGSGGGINGPPPPTRYAYRDERSGNCVICGISALVCGLICICCFLPLIIIIPVVWVTTWSGDDDAFHDDFVHDNGRRWLR